MINDFNFAGGEGYTVFGERTLETRTGGLLIEAMEHYLGAHDPYTGDPMPRVVFTP